MNPWWWNTPEIQMRSELWREVNYPDEGGDEKADIKFAAAWWRDQLLANVSDWFQAVDMYLPVALDAFHGSQYADEALAFMLELRDDPDQAESADYRDMDDVEKALRAQLENASTGQIIGYGDFYDWGEEFFAEAQPPSFQAFYESALEQG
jgi:hypothetical protein